MPSTLVLSWLHAFLAQLRDKLCHRLRVDHVGFAVAAMNRLAKRLGRLESKALPNYSSLAEIPTPVLEATVRNAFREGNHSPEEAELYHCLQVLGRITFHVALIVT